MGRVDVDAVAHGHRDVERLVLGAVGVQEGLVLGNQANHPLGGENVAAHPHLNCDMRFD